MGYSFPHVPESPISFLRLLQSLTFSLSVSYFVSILCLGPITLQLSSGQLKFRFAKIQIWSNGPFTLGKSESDQRKTTIIKEHFGFRCELASN